MGRKAYKTKMKHYKAQARRSGADRAGEVTVIKADGSIETRRPYGPRQLARVIAGATPQREPTPQPIRMQVVKRDGWRCRYCGVKVGYAPTVAKFEIDHVTPVSLGGSEDLDNLVTACRECNRLKGSKVWTPLPL